MIVSFARTTRADRRASFRLVDVRPLRPSASPDVPDFAIHMTGRFGPRAGLLPLGLNEMLPVDRLLKVLMDQFLIAGAQFGVDQPSVCFTQTTPAALAELCTVTSTPMRYDGCGIGFHLQSVFDAGGGPALYIRGDEWEALQAAALPATLRARTIRYWPGSEPAGATPLPHALVGESQWLHEREWRIPAPADAISPWRWGFKPSDVAFLLLPGSIGLDNFVGRIADESASQWALQLPIAATVNGGWEPVRGDTRWMSTGSASA
jgi:hypothetical protein